MIYTLIVLTSFYCNGPDCVKVMPAKSMQECQEHLTYLRAHISAAADDEVRRRIAEENLLEIDTLEIIKGQLRNGEAIDLLSDQSGDDEEKRLYEVAAISVATTKDHVAQLTEARTHIFKSLECVEKK